MKSFMLLGNQLQYNTNYKWYGIYKFTETKVRILSINSAPTMMLVARFKRSMNMMIARRWVFGRLSQLASYILVLKLSLATKISLPK